MNVQNSSLLSNFLILAVSSFIGLAIVRQIHHKLNAIKKQSVPVTAIQKLAVSAVCLQYHFSL
jgi:hypothetical protein